jgi:hypothetical protein
MLQFNIIFNDGGHDFHFSPSIVTFSISNWQYTKNRLKKLFAF